MWQSMINSKLREKFLAALILIMFLVVYYNSVLTRGNSFMTTMERSYQLGHYHYSGVFWHIDRKLATLDPAAANQINLPTAYLEHHYLKSRQLPLWNPYSGLGRPYNADMNSYTFFLPLYPFKLFPSLIIYDLFLIFRLFMAGFFLFLLLRLYECQFLIALAGSIFYMFNSHFHAFVDMDHLNVTMFLSAMSYFLTKFLFTMDKRYLGVFVLCSAGSFYGGNPNEFILIHLFISLYFLFLLLINKSLDLEIKLNCLLFYGGALIFSLLLSSVKLIPFAEFWQNSLSTRTGGLLGSTNFLPLKKLMAWLLTPDRMYSGPNYAGFLILSLMFFSLFNLMRNKWKLREKLVAFHFCLLFLAVSKIIAAPYINWMGALPILNSIDYVKYCSLAYYLISIIAAFSLTYLAESIKNEKKIILRFSAFLMCCVLPHLLFSFISKKSIFQAAGNGKALLYLFVFFILTGSFLIMVKRTLRNKKALSFAFVVMMLLPLSELRLNNHQYYRKRFMINDKAPYTQFLLTQKKPYRTLGVDGTLFANHNLVYPIPSISRTFAMRIERPAVLLSKLVSSKFNSGMGEIYRPDEVLNNPYLDLLNTKYYISEDVIDSIVINPEYAISHDIKALLDNPSMRYTSRGNFYYYIHRGWEQVADSSLDIPLHLPYGDVYLKATALAFNFDWSRRDNPNNKLHLIIAVKQGMRKEIVYRRTFVAHRKENQDFFNLKVDVSKYSGQEVILNFTLCNAAARTLSDRLFFFGDLRITYNKTLKSSASGSEDKKSEDVAHFETVPYEDVFSHHAIVYRNNRALERGFVLYDIKKIKDINEAITVMKKEPFIYRRTALIEGDLPENMRWGKVGQSKISFIDYRPNYINIHVETTENGVFILSDVYYPGWKAYINKKEVKIYAAFGALRAVLIPEGKHQLEFKYRPWTFYSGAFLTFLSFVFLLFLCLKPKTSPKSLPSNFHDNR